jgi:hypothetical protein
VRTSTSRGAGVSIAISSISSGALSARMTAAFIAMPC